MFSLRKPSRSRLSTMGVGFALVLSIVSMLAGNILTIMAASKQTRTDHLAQAMKDSLYRFVSSNPKPPTDKQCRQKQGFPCYSPQEMRNAYGLTKLLNRGYDGTGQTIIIIDSYGSPTIAADLHTFDLGYGLPDPPSLKVYAPLGTVPYNPKDNTMIGWAQETSIDVEWAHAMAPGAKIALMTSPVAETQGIQGMPQFLFLEQYALDHRLGNIISQSWTTTENTLFTPGGRQVLTSFDNFYKQAKDAHVTVFTSSGDSGVANPDQDGEQYSFPTVNFPASDPYVTAVGGTHLKADIHGNYQSEVGWTGSGGGVSQYWKEPVYQVKYLPVSDQKILNGYRGLPDISYDADPNTGILIWTSFMPNGPKWSQWGGTSISAPQWAGITADANQFAGHPLGFLNDKLYAIASSRGNKADFHDITSGNNSGGGLPGYNCTPGWDPVTGWGTPIAANLVYDLVAMRNIP